MDNLSIPLFLFTEVSMKNCYQPSKLQNKCYVSSYPKLSSASSCCQNLKEGSSYFNDGYNEISVLENFRFSVLAIGYTYEISKEHYKYTSQISHEIYSYRSSSISDHYIYSTGLIGVH